MRNNMNKNSKYTDRLDAMKAGATTEKEIEAAITKKKEVEYTARFTDFLQTGEIVNALKEGSDGSGGYLVPKEYDKRVVETLKEENLLRKLGTVVNTERDMLFPTLEEGVQGVWVPEGETYSFGEMKYGQIEIEAHKLMVGVRITDELLSDAGFDIEDYTIRVFAEAIGEKEEEAFFTGQGEHIPTGLMYCVNNIVVS